MSEFAQSFVDYLSNLKERDRGALAHLRRSLAFAPGAYPGAYPYVERFVGAEKHARDPWRLALYLTGGLFALHAEHRAGTSFAKALGELALARRRQGSDGVEKRFIVVLGSEPESLPTMLRQACTLLSADGHAFDFVRLLDDLPGLLGTFNVERRDRVRQTWARDFYRVYDMVPDETSAPDAITAS